MQCKACNSDTTAVLDKHGVKTGEQSDFMQTSLGDHIHVVCDSEERRADRRLRQRYIDEGVILPKA